MPKSKTKGKTKNTEQREPKNSAQNGLSPWIWAIIGAGAGMVVWLLMRLISGMIGG